MFYIPEPICLADNRLDFVVGCFDPDVAHPRSDRAEDVIFMVMDLLIEATENRYPAVA